MNNLTNYTQEDIQNSIQLGKKLLQRGIIVDHKLKWLINDAKDAKLPNITNNLELHYCMKTTESFCQTLKFTLFDRLEANCKKKGRSLVIGSCPREVFEHLCVNWQGKRDIKVLKKGRAELDYSVFIAYNFQEGHQFLNFIPKKVKYVDELQSDQRTIRQWTYGYRWLTLLLDVQTDLVHCEWEQFSDKVEDNADKEQGKDCCKRGAASNRNLKIQHPNVVSQEGSQALIEEESQVVNVSQAQLQPKLQVFQRNKCAGSDL